MDVKLFIYEAIRFVKSALKWWLNRSFLQCCWSFIWHYGRSESD